MTTFIYGLTDPKSGDIRYVGKSYAPQKRFKRHLSKRERSFNTPKAIWINTLLAENLTPGIVILEEVVISEWKDCERKWIDHFRNVPGYPLLTNSAEGGNGGDRPNRPHPIVLKNRHNVTQPSDPNIRFVPLTQGKIAVIDTKWFTEISAFNWTASWDRRAKTFYASRRIQVGDKSTTLLMHRVIAGNDYPHVDHWNGDGLNNTEDNLRKCSVSQNGGNRRINQNNKSGYKGVFLSSEKKKYCAEIRVCGKKIYLGAYIDPREAAKAYDVAAVKHFGEFARTNFLQATYLS